MDTSPGDGGAIDAMADGSKDVTPGSDAIETKDAAGEKPGKHEHGGCDVAGPGGVPGSCVLVLSLAVVLTARRRRSALATRA